MLYKAHGDLLVANRRTTVSHGSGTNVVHSISDELQRREGPALLSLLYCRSPIAAIGTDLYQGKVAIEAPTRTICAWSESMSSACRV